MVFCDENAQDLGVKTLAGLTWVAFSVLPLSSRLLGLSGEMRVPRKNSAAKTQANPRLKRHHHT